MRKASKWIKSFLNSGKKGQEKEKENGNIQPSIPTENPTTPIIIPTATEKRRWSFRRSPAVGKTAKDLNSTDTVSTSASVAHTGAAMEAENELKQHAMAVAAATAAPAAVISLTNADAPARTTEVEEAAAIKIQAAFRSYLAKRALCALKGLVKLQALVRGQLVRRQATAILRCMQALVSVQERAQAQRRVAGEAHPIIQTQSIHRKSSQDISHRRACSIDRGLLENIKIVEMELGQPRGSSNGRNSYSNQPQERVDPRFSAYYLNKQDQLQNSPAPSAKTQMSPRTSSGHFEEFSFTTAKSSPQYYSAVSKLDPARTPFAFIQNECTGSVSTDYPFYPNYMANTESSRAKLRSHSAPKQRSESYERQPSSRRSTMEERNIPPVRMQRSSSHVGYTGHGHQYPWSIKLDRSTMSLQDSDCGSTSTVLTNANYCRSFSPCR